MESWQITVQVYSLLIKAKKSRVNITAPLRPDFGRLFTSGWLGYTYMYVSIEWVGYDVGTRQLYMFN
jgi:hypothetical protein